MKNIIAIVILLVASAVGVFFYIQLGNNSSVVVEANQLPSEHLSSSMFQDALDTGAYTLLDIRTIEEYKTGHIQGAKQIDFYQTATFSNYLSGLDKNKGYLIYCRSGNRTGKALTMMKQMGFTKVADLEGGFTSWTSNNLPVE